jgi:hypothetical protein
LNARDDAPNNDGAAHLTLKRVRQIAEEEEEEVAGADPVEVARLRLERARAEQQAKIDAWEQERTRPLTERTRTYLLSATAEGPKAQLDPTSDTDTTAAIDSGA